MDTVLNLIFDTSLRDVFDPILISDARWVELVTQFHMWIGETYLGIYMVVWTDQTLSALVYFVLPTLVSSLMNIWKWNAIDRCLESLCIARSVLSRSAEVDDGREFTSLLNSLHRDRDKAAALVKFVTGKAFTNYQCQAEWDFVQSVYNKWKGFPVLIVYMLTLLNVVGYMLVHSSGYIISGGGDLSGAPDGPVAFVVSYVCTISAMVLAAHFVSIRCSERWWRKTLNNGVCTNNLLGLHPTIYY